MNDEEKVSLVRTLSDMAMNAELAGTELEFYEYLLKFFEQQAKKHYIAGYAQAQRDQQGAKKW